MLDQAQIAFDFSQTAVSSDQELRLNEYPIKILNQAVIQQTNPPQPIYRKQVNAAGQNPSSS